MFHIGKLLERRGLGPQANRDETDTLLHNQPLLAELYSASISALVATGPRAGHRVAKVCDEIDLEELVGPTGRVVPPFPASVCMPMSVSRPRPHAAGAPHP